VSDVKIKALGPDNSSQIRELPRLFAAAWGQTFPSSGVYRESFWRGHIGRRFTSVAATVNGRIAAHIALRPVPGSPGDIELCLPACAPEDRALLPDFMDAAWEMIRRQGQRQAWRSIFSCGFESVHPLDQTISRMFHGREIALLPGLLPTAAGRIRGFRMPRASRLARESSRGHAVLSFRALTPHDDVPLDLYVPEQHLEVCRLLYGPLGLPRRFWSAPPAEHTAGLNADRRGIERSWYRSSGVRMSLVAPSLVSPREDLEGRCFDGQQASFLLVDMRDPACPEFADSLETRGYRFCGVVPLLYGQESLIYCKETEQFADRGGFTSPRSRMICRYVQDYDLPLALDTLVSRETTQATSVAAA